jgi:predicted amidophosphoribosyltransferase
VNCPACGHENPDDAGFCGECGGSLAHEIECPGCGRETPPGQKFCHGCGRPSGHAARPSQDRTPRDYTPKHLADKILQSKSALEGERKQVTVLTRTCRQNAVWNSPTPRPMAPAKAPGA